MKKVLILTLCILLSMATFAQDEEVKKNEEIRTLLGNNLKYGGFMGLSVNYSILNDVNAIVLGARAGWVINHSLTLGLGGAGFISEAFAAPAGIPELSGTDYRIAGGYGGFLIEPTLFAKKPIHVTFPIIIGVGGVSYFEDYRETNVDNWEDTTQDDDGFFVIEPGVQMEINLLKFLRLDVGAQYRYTSKVNLESFDVNPKPLTDDNVLNGLSYGITLKFGWF